LEKRRKSHKRAFCAKICPSTYFCLFFNTTSRPPHTSATQFFMSFFTLFFQIAKARRSIRAVIMYLIWGMRYLVAMGLLLAFYAFCGSFRGTHKSGKPIYSLVSELSAPFCATAATNRLFLLLPCEGSSHFSKSTLPLCISWACFSSK